MERFNLEKVHQIFFGFLLPLTKNKVLKDFLKIRGQSESVNQSILIDIKMEKIKKDENR